MLTQRKEITNLNGTQTNTICGMISFPLEIITETLSKNPLLLKRALQCALLEAAISKQLILQFNSKEVLECISQISQILAHPCPQNRGESYPYVGQEKNFSMFKLDKSKIKSICTNGNIELKNGRVIQKDCVISNNSHDDYIIAKEPQGLLSLTSREDDKIPPVTKEGVIEYVRQLILGVSNKINDTLADEETENKSKDILRAHRFFKTEQSANYFDYRAPYIQLRGALTFYELSLLPIPELLILDENSRNVLIENIQKCRAELDRLTRKMGGTESKFLENLNYLLGEGIPLKQIAQLNSEDQIAILTTHFDLLNIVMASGINFEKLVNLPPHISVEILTWIRQNEDQHPVLTKTLMYSDDKTREQDRQNKIKFIELIEETINKHIPPSPGAHP